MRRGREPKLVLKGLEVIGVNLGSDFTAEHECGIGPIKKKLGIPSDTTIKENRGIKGRTITVFNEELFFFERKETHTCLLFDIHGHTRGYKWQRDYELDPDPEEISAAWSDTDFGVITANSPIYGYFLPDLYEAFKKKDVAILPGGCRFIENPGLMIMIASKFPTEADEELRKRDGSHFRLHEAVEKTNIRAILKAAGKQYLALSPKWKDNEEKEIIYWLNPWHQDVDNSGWFTLQDLLDWVKNEGPILMKKK